MWIVQVWRPASALFFAVLAQICLEPSIRKLEIGVALYALAAILFIWHCLRRGDPEWSPPSWEDVPDEGAQWSAPAFLYRPNAAVIGGLILVLAFILFGGNQFTPFNLAVWISGAGVMIYAFWQQEGSRNGDQPSHNARLRAWLARAEFRLHLTPERILLAATLLLVFFFRFYDLNGVPPEMFSDHAEKLLDVYDVLHGNTQIFFPRNTGREAVQMYLTAAVIELFGTGYSFLSLKIGTALLGFLTLIYLYLTVRDYAGSRAAYFAIFFAGISYWHNVISRVALRFTLTPFFLAPTLYYLLRGYRRRSLNDFILSGIFLGLGLHGYSTMRIVPFLIVLALLLYLVHRQSRGWRKQAFYALLVLAFMSLIVFLPLLRYVMENPDMFSYRAFTRLGSVERPLPGPIAQVFLDNFWKASSMFFWDDGEIWVHSVPHRPALDFISAALFLLGLIFFLVRYARSRDWQTLFILVSIPILMLPSTLSLAFPAENPSLNRTGGAIIPVFLIVGVVLDSLLGSLSGKPVFADSRPGGGTLPKNASRSLPVPLIVMLALGMVISAAQNFDLVFNKYRSLFASSAWNTSELGRVVRGFSESIGSPEQAWVIAYPHWVDTRLVGINAGYPKRDFGIWPKDLESTLAEKRTRLFLLKPEDKDGLAALVNLFPSGTLQVYPSSIKDKDFYMYIVPAEADAAGNTSSGKP